MPVDRPLLGGKVGLVTGGGSGMGRSTALAMARAGAAVMLVGRREALLRSVADEVEALGARAAIFAGDVTQRDMCRDMVRQCVSELGALDLAFNNAGGHGNPTPIDTTDEDEEDHYLALNFNAAYWGVKYQVAQMRQSGGGAIVNNASIFGLKGMACLAHYTAAKFGVIGLTKAVALECAPAGIRVNAVAPGGTETPNFMRVMGDAHAMDSMVPMGRIGQPDEVANAVVWLMSDQASYVTGAVLSVDGGLSAG